MCCRIGTAVLVLSAALAACDPGAGGGGGSGGSVDQPANAFVASAPFTSALPDAPHIIRPPNNTTNCAPGSNIDVSRSVSGTANASLGDIGPTATLASGVRDVGVTVPDGVYAWSNRPLNWDCFQTGPAPVGPFRATFSFSYRAEIDQDNQPELCVFRSRIEFSSFTVTGIPPLDDEIQADVKDETHRGVDRVIADRMSQFVRGRPFPSDAEPRCDNWSVL